MDKSILFLKTDNKYLKNMYLTTQSRHHAGDSGLDLFCPKDVIINPGETKLIDLEFCSEMVEFKNDIGNNVSYYMYPRSSLSKTPLIVTNSVGIIDAGYRGNLKIALRNLGDDPYSVQKGDRLVQICQRYLEPFDVNVVNKLSDSSRGAGGFGSTGK